MTSLRPLAAIASLSLAACAHTLPPSPQDAFWSALQSHCGKAYAGEMVSEDARDADWAGKRMIGHWAECGTNRVAIAFHVEDPAAEGGWNRSRTWVVSRENYENAAQTTTLFTLKHDHRHADGHEDAVTQYGGLTRDRGTARAQDFPVDMMSIDLFKREGLGASLTNVWRIEIDLAGAPGARFAYQLTRGNDPTRRFRVELDASTPVPAPPPAWGW